MHFEVVALRKIADKIQEVVCDKTLLVSSFVLDVLSYVY